MSGSGRTAIRSALKAALLADPRFSGWAPLRGWSQAIEAANLPALGVFTPRETKSREGVRTYRTGTEVSVLVKRAGGATLEDDLDADADAIEAMALVILDGIAEDVELSQTETDIPGAGEARVGTMMLTFRVLSLPDA